MHSIAFKKGILKAALSGGLLATIPTGAQGLAVDTTANLWPEGVVYYTFDQQLSPDIKQAFIEVTRHFRMETEGVVAFVRRNRSNSDAITHGRHIYVRGRDDIGQLFSPLNGQAFLGWGKDQAKTGANQFDISTHLMPNSTRRVIAHELLHTLGFAHEDARPDRDATRWWWREAIDDEVRGVTSFDPNSRTWEALITDGRWALSPLDSEGIKRVYHQGFKSSDGSKRYDKIEVPDLDDYRLAPAAVYVGENKPASAFIVVNDEVEIAVIQTPSTLNVIAEKVSDTFEYWKEMPSTHVKQTSAAFHDWMITVQPKGKVHLAEREDGIIRIQLTFKSGPKTGLTKLIELRYGIYPPLDQTLQQRALPWQFRLRASAINKGKGTLHRCLTPVAKAKNWAGPSAHALTLDPCPTADPTPWRVTYTGNEEAFFSVSHQDSDYAKLCLAEVKDPAEPAITKKRYLGLRPCSQVNPLHAAHWFSPNGFLLKNRSYPAAQLVLESRPSPDQAARIRIDGMDADHPADTADPNRLLWDDLPENMPVVQEVN